MAFADEEKKKNLIIKTWKRCRSMGRHNNNNSNNNNDNNKSPFLSKCNSWDESLTSMAPDGCFNVYVGPVRRRFSVKIEWANHQLFRMLLEDAELEYGFKSQGPIMLPCDVDVFLGVMAQIENGGPESGSCSPFSSGERFNGVGNVKQGIPMFQLSISQK
ncbi:protein SMALL AUXIN UP-REGULATED RNA 10-like [Impatiens glandulifera]|uniref:protein SMALL AUXIN UP-REGULATED RNA 10-like n=1 Tax=Impatiens glandulifera TaxID=253017 RepID=UPI001FB0B902|nr:protein SMALL AUXIN UP-REGULATED RNA 10-like [Impatiens glandulifera]